MQDRCARLGALVARLTAAQQREQRGGDGDRDGEKGLEQLFEGQGDAEQQKQDVCFAAEEVRCTVTSLLWLPWREGWVLFSSCRSKDRAKSGFVRNYSSSPPPVSPPRRRVFGLLH